METLIAHLIVGFLFRRILSGRTVFNVEWMFFVVILTAGFILVELFPAGLFIDEKKYDGLVSWGRLFARNAAIVGVQSLIG